MPDTLPANFCPYCGKPVQPDAFFCPNCGKELQERQVPITLLTQIGVYALSIFLPPLGLWPGIKYVRRNDPKAKQVGWIAIILTVISTIATIWGTFALLNVYVNTITGSLGGAGLY